MNNNYFNDDRTLLIRALNATKHAYYPSYIGLRLLSEQLPDSNYNYLEKMLTRRLNSNEIWKFRSFQMYKGSTTENGITQHEYRNCLASSPITALAESLILATIANEKNFNFSSRVYSYRWPATERSSSSYEFFAKGYHQRNHDISVRLNDQNKIAVVTDIKRFYPSIDKDNILGEMKKKLSASSQKFMVAGESIYHFIEQLIDTSPNGVPIGPSTSHFLGQLALKDFDNELESVYGSDYFRYVDDIVIVCSQNDEEKVKSSIYSYLLKYGYQVNTDKTITITQEDWDRNIIKKDIVGEDDFRQLTGDICVYLALHPNRKTELKDILSDAGLSIPIDRLDAISKYSRFRHFIKRRKSQSAMLKSAQMLFSDNDSFLKRALNLKATYENSLYELINSPVESQPNLRRWQTQRARRITNTLFYLKNFREWKTNSGVFDCFPELIEQQALAAALSTGEVNSVLPFFGRGPAAFAELWAEHGTNKASVDENALNLNAPEIDGLTTLCIHGVIPDLVINQNDNPNTRLLSAASASIITSRSNPDLSFEDEFESLRLGKSSHDIAQLSKTRYASAESTGLEALSLLTSEYRS